MNESIEKSYYSIVRNSEELNKTCLVCLKKNEDFIPILNEDDDNNIINLTEYDNNSIIDDINKGVFRSLIDYVTPKNCRHLYLIYNFKKYKAFWILYSERFI